MRKIISMIRKTASTRIRQWGWVTIRVLFAMLAISCVSAVLPGTAAANTVKKVNNILQNIGGTVYFSGNPTYQNLYFQTTDNKWHVVTEAANSAKTLKNGWTISKGTSQKREQNAYIIHQSRKLSTESTTLNNQLTIKWANAGYTAKGETFDVLITFKQVVLSCTSKPGTYDCKIMTMWPSLEVGPSNRTRLKEQNTVNYRFVKHNTNTLIDGSNVINYLFFDIDQPAKPASGYTYNSDDCESVFQSTANGLLPQAIISTQSKLRVKNANGGTYFFATENDTSSSPTNYSSVILQGKPDSTVMLRGTNCGTDIGIGAYNKVTSYPGPPDASKTPDSQTKKRGETAAFDVTAFLPYVTGTNKASSIVMTDTLDMALDIGKANVVVSKWNGNKYVDVTSNWTISKNGRTITAVAKNTAHGYAEDTHKFHITAPVSTTLNMSKYATSGDNYVIPNTATITVNNIKKTTKTVNVLVPKPHPSLSLTKDVTPTNVSDAKAGDEVTWKVIVTNNGNVTVSDIALTDQLLKDRGISVIPGQTSLAPDESTTASMVMPITQYDIDAGHVTNTAKASGRCAPDNMSVESNEDTADVTLDRHAALSIDKSVDKASATIGDKLTYTITIKNTGNVTLAPVNLTDPLVGANAEQVSASLDAGASVTVKKTYTAKLSDAVAGKVVNTATAHGTPPDGVNAPDDPSSSVTTVVTADPRLSVTKEVDKETAGIGDTLTYTITVSNTGDMTLAPVTVTDEMLGINGETVAESLAPGKNVSVKKTYVTTLDDAASGNVKNVAKAHGVPPKGFEPPDDPEDDVTTRVVARPHLSIAKDVDRESAMIGDWLTYTITVTNDGDVPLAPVTVTDGMLGMDAEKVADSLAAGESRSINRRYKVTLDDAVKGSVRNVASAHGTPPGVITPPEDPTDDAVTGVTAHPGLSIEKTSDKASARVGETLTYTIVVTNTGDVPLAPVTVTDRRLGIVAERVSDSLVPGESASMTRTHVITEDDAKTGMLRNVASAHGMPPEGIDPPEDPNDDAVVFIMYALPLTGANGVIPFLVSGAAVIMAGALCKRRK